MMVVYCVLVDGRCALRVVCLMFACCSLSVVGRCSLFVVWYLLSVVCCMLVYVG